MDRPEELEFTWLILIGISLTFLLSLAVVVFFVYYQRKLYAQRVALEQLKLEEQKKRLEAEINGRESEKSRIALDLHDEIGALLSTVKLYISFPKAVPAIDNDNTLKKAQQMLDDAVTKLRGISRNLSPENLRLFGLTSAIDQQCRILEEANVFTVNFEHNLENRLKSDVETHLYRIVQELLNNTLKHARATNVKLDLIDSGDRLKLQYIDNGLGFEPETANTGQSLGITSLSSRVQILNGEIDIQSAPGQGIKVTIILPKLQTLRT